jgi:hypothetical protein
MRGFFFVLVLLAVAIVGVGLYRGWFQVSTQKGEEKSTVSITVDKNKIKADEEKVKDKVQDLGRQVKDKAGDGTAKDQDRQP